MPVSAEAVCAEVLPPPPTPPTPGCDDKKRWLIILNGKPWQMELIGSGICG